MINKLIFIFIIGVIMALMHSLGFVLTHGKEQVWKTGKNLNYKRYGHQLTTKAGKIWVTGGRDLLGNYLEVEVYDPEYKRSIKTGIITGEKYHRSIAFSALFSSENIYLLSNTGLLRINTLTYEKKELIQFTDEDFAAQNWGSIYYKSQEYIVIIGKEKLKFFDPYLEKFTQSNIFSEPLPIRAAGSCILNNSIYLFGGHNKFEEKNMDVWKISFNEGPQVIAKLLWHYDQVNVECQKEKAWLIGGMTEGYYYSTVLEFNFDNNEITRKNDLSEKLWLGDTTLFRNRIWISWGKSWGRGKNIGKVYLPNRQISYNPFIDIGELGLSPYSKYSTIDNDLKFINLSWVDANEIGGENQQYKINWISSKKFNSGFLYYKKEDEKNYSKIRVTAKKITQGLDKISTYTAVIDDLLPDTRYRYYVESMAGGYDLVSKSKVASFKTFPKKMTNVNFSVIGELGLEKEIINNISERITEDASSQFVVQMGNLTNYNVLDEWESILDDTKKTNRFASFARQNIILNNSLQSRTNFVWNNLFQTKLKPIEGWPNFKNRKNQGKWYSFNLGRVHFIFLTLGENGNESWYENDQIEWFYKDFSYASWKRYQKELDWIIVIMNKSPFSSNFNDSIFYKIKPSLKKSYMDIIERYRADIVVSGGGFDYLRTNQIKGLRINSDTNNSLFWAENKRVNRENPYTYGRGVIWVNLGIGNRIITNLNEQDIWQAKRIGKDDDDNVYFYSQINIFEKKLELKSFMGTKNDNEFKLFDQLIIQK